ncbi:MAG TPA: sensor histidine kinase, partial [Dactylosporangium sp.]|nr:sensor histidine kinase [Dactylosporangium sp.]
SGLGEADRAAFAQLVGARRQLRAIAAPDAPGGAAGAPGAGGGPDLLDVALVAAEDGLLRGDAAVDAAAWRGAVDPALSEGRAATTAAARAQADADAGPGAWTIGLAGLFAGLGLIAVLLLYRMFGRRSAVAGGEPADDAVLVRLAQRSQALLHRQLAVLDDLQRRDRDPGELAALFRADQLATQLRRHAERAILLAGLEPGRRWRRPVPLVDVARAAAASVERHVVVMVAAVDAGALAGPAVGAVTHLLTELVDNATRATTGDATVWVGGEMGLTAYTVTVQDRGPGMTARDLAAARDALARPYRPPAPGETPRVGLRLAGRLARAHDIEVELEPAPRGGIVARVRIPVALIVTSEEPADDVAPDLEPSGEHAGGLPVRVPGTVPASAAGFARRGGPRAPVDRTARFRDRLAARGRGAPGTDERETAEIPAQRSTVDDSPQP